MGGRTRFVALALALLAACSDDRSPAGAPCTGGTQCQTGLCLERPTGAVCVARCAADADCLANEVCGRFDFRGRDDSGVPAGKESDVVSVCRPPLQARCAGSCAAPGERCVGEADPVCTPACRDRVDCGGRDCLVDGCGPGHCAPACDGLRDCPAFSVCDTAFLGTDGHGRCLAVASGATDAGAAADATCADAR